MMTVECAFCEGIGKDPYEILSKLSKCPVCNGRMKVEVTKPAYPCAYCHGTGKQRHTRLTCSACKGTGHVTVAGPTAECPECDGSGKTHGPDLSCAFCRGAGLIAERSTEKSTVPE
jgi:DnaJ-class molecular chaperone